jgi:hypothetical protein
MHIYSISKHYLKFELSKFLNHGDSMHVAYIETNHTPLKDAFAKASMHARDLQRQACIFN